MAIPSLAMIPSGYKDGKVYSVLPSNGDGDFTFSRGSSATRVNQDGLIEEITDQDTPRLDYSDGSCPSLLLEPQSTNLLPYSEDFSNIDWNLDDATIVGNNTISPNGTQNAVLLKGNTNSSRHSIIKSYSQQNANTSFSVFVKAKELRYVQIASANDVNQYVNFDVSIGIVGTVGSTFSNAKIEAIGSDGWYRLSVVATRSNGLYISLVSGLTASWLESWTMSNNTDGLYIWGAQYEIGSYATSYIPTNGAVATRLADECVNTSAGSVIGQTEGTMYTEYYFDATIDNNGGADRDIISIAADSSNNINIVHYGNGSSSYNKKVYLYALVGGSYVVTISSPTQSSGLMKVACGYKNNDYVLYVNGIQIGTDTSASVPTCSIVTLGKNPINTPTPINETKLYNTRLSNSELQELTTI